MLELKDDKLDRKPFLNSLYNLFDNFGNQGNKGLTILINGKYGSGKTTMLGFIKENNADDKFSVIEYNAWENNLFDNPLIPILNEINQLNSTKNKIKETALNLIKKFPKALFSTLANAHGVDFTAFLENEDIFKEYKEYQKSLNDYRKILAEYCAAKKVLFLVDELDRCLPEYQIKVLETIYHLLNIPNLIVVIALDREQLECSIKNYFGEEKNTFGYLAKFIDYQIDLPDDNNMGFVCSLLKFECESGYTYAVQRLIVEMFEIFGLSIRECQHLVDEINLICNETDGNGEPIVFRYWYPFFVALVVLSKYQCNEIYKKWFYREKKLAYIADDIHFKESDFYKFLNDIQNTKLGEVVERLRQPNEENDIAVEILVNLINAFTPIRMIYEADLAEYTKLNVRYIQELKRECRNAYALNGIIKQVKLLNFK